MAVSEPLEEPCTESPTSAESSTAEPDPGLTAAGARLGTYMAEAGELRELGWNVRFRLEAGGIVAEIGSPDQFTRGQFTRHVLWQLPEKSRAWTEVEIAKRTHFRTAKRHLTFEDKIGMDHVLFLTIFSAWRDHYDGRLPFGWPLPKVGQ